MKNCANCGQLISGNSGTAGLGSELGFALFCCRNCKKQYYSTRPIRRSIRGCLVSVLGVGLACGAITFVISSMRNEKVMDSAKDKFERIKEEKKEIIQQIKDEADPFTNNGPSESAKRDSAKKLSDLENDKRNQLKEHEESVKSPGSSSVSNEAKSAAEEQSNTDDGEKKEASASLLKAQMGDKLALKKASEQNETKSKLAELKGELAAVNAKIDSERARYQSNLGIINKLTNFKRTPVREGTQAYFQCVEASKQIKDVENGVPGLKAEKAKLEATIKELE
jgi:hypothetical protein